MLLTFLMGYAFLLKISKEKIDTKNNQVRVRSKSFECIGDE